MADLGTISCQFSPTFKRCDLPLSSAQAGAVTAVFKVNTEPFYQYVPFWTSPAPSLSVNTQGVISGVVNENATPVSRCAVRLYYRSTGAFIRSTFTDASGAFSFSGLDPSDIQAYTCVAFDPEGGVQYNAVIFDRLTAV